MSVPVTLENCKYVYIGGREVVELPRSFPSKKPPDAAHQPHFVGRCREKMPRLRTQAKIMIIQEINVRSCHFGKL
jgi:hypothetical protein